VKLVDSAVGQLPATCEQLGHVEGLLQGNDTRSRERRARVAFHQARCSVRREHQQVVTISDQGYQRERPTERM
jgi:hypothetical protein